MGDLISVIVPIYRVEQYLEQCIESIINQTYKNLEIILVNDGSDDSCPDICDRYAKIDARIKVIHKENGGLDEARKTGIKLARGKYIGYVDGDDWIEFNMYEKLIHYANKYNVDIVESGVIDFWDTKEIKRRSFFQEGVYKNSDFDKEIGPNLIYSGKFFSHGISPYLCNKLFLKESILEFQLLPQPKDGFVDDIIVTLPTIAKSRSIYISKDCLYHYRVRCNTLKRKVYLNAEDKIFDNYSDWKLRFNGVVEEYNINKQFQYFLMYTILLKCAYIFDDENSDTFLTPFGKININDKIILYGAGQCGINLQNYIKNKRESNLVCWVDKNYEFLSQYYNVENPNLISELEYDYVIISVMSEQVVEEIKKDLEKLQIDKNKIKWISNEYISDPNILLKQVKNMSNQII